LSTRPLSSSDASISWRGIVVVITATMRPVSLRTGALTTEMPRSNDDSLIAKPRRASTRIRS
jgi:hypothetical protein